jgi:predicted DNA-binding ribbon-helix-helix protein
VGWGAFGHVLSSERRQGQAMIRRPELSLQRTKRSIVVDGHKTSIRLEDAFWHSLKEIAAHEGIPVHQLVKRIDGDRDHANLSSHLRLYVLEHYRGLVDLGLTVKQKRT